MVIFKKKGVPSLFMKLSLLEQTLLKNSEAVGKTALCSRNRPPPDELQASLKMTAAHIKYEAAFPSGVSAIFLRSS